VRIIKSVLKDRRAQNPKVSVLGVNVCAQLFARADRRPQSSHLHEVASLELREELNLSAVPELGPVSPDFSMPSLAASNQMFHKFLSFMQ
jgi:hypothetical protein